MDFSALIPPFCFIILLGIGVIPLLKHVAAGGEAGAPEPGLSQWLVIPGAVSFISYSLFFAVSGWVWSFHTELPIENFTPYVRTFVAEYDGIESVVLYLLLLATMASTVALASWTIRSRPGQQLTILCIAFALCGWYMLSVGFIPPMSTAGIRGIMPVPALAVISAVLFGLYRTYPAIGTAVIILLTGISTFVYPNTVSHVDIAYIIGPALKLQHGCKPQDIYFQYDMLLSLIALLYIKCGIALKWFAYLAPVSFFALITTVFLFTRQFFKTKGLAVLLVITIVVVRLYTGPSKAMSLFQVSPLRLDLWIIPLLLVYRKGVYHWATGLCLGLLILLHRNLGIIYTAAWIELAIALLLAEAAGEQGESLTKRVAGVAMKHFRLSRRNLVIISSSLALCLILFHELFSPGLLTYREVGIGMIQVAQSSFYWYVPVALASVCSLIYAYRVRLAGTYVTTGLFIVLLATGNLLYFFGRSHENALLNISVVLLLALFLLFDMLISFFPRKTWVLPGSSTMAFSRYWALPVTVILLAGYYYAVNVGRNATVKMEALTSGNIVGDLHPTLMDAAHVRKLTGNSEKVYFLDLDNDVYNYYNGGYMPPGYYTPGAATVFRDEWRNVLQQLLDDGYYIVFPADGYGMQAEYIKGLRFGHHAEDAEIAAVYK